MRLTLLFLSALFIAGCNVMLPSGKAPEGRITDNSANTGAALTSDEFENHAATSLCGYILTNGTLVSLHCTDAAAQRVLARITPVTGVYADKHSSRKLSRKNGCFVLLSEDGKILWQYPQQ